MTEQFTEAYVDSAVARAFGREPAERVDAGEAGLEVAIAEAFGRKPSAWARAPWSVKANRGRKVAPVSTSSAPEAQVGCLVQRIQEFAESRGMSEPDAKAFALSEVLVARGLTASVAETAVELDRRFAKLRAGVADPHVRARLAGQPVDLSEAQLDTLIANAFSGAR